MSNFFSQARQIWAEQSERSVMLLAWFGLSTGFVVLTVMFVWEFFSANTGGIF